MSYRFVIAIIPKECSWLLVSRTLTILTVAGQSLQLSVGGTIERYYVYAGVLPKTQTGLTLRLFRGVKLVGHSMLIAVRQREVVLVQRMATHEQVYSGGKVCDLYMI